MSTPSRDPQDPVLVQVLTDAIRGSIVRAEVAGLPAGQNREMVVRAHRDLRARELLAVGPAPTAATSTPRNDDECAEVIAETAIAQLPEGWRLLVVSYSPHGELTDRVHVSSNIPQADLGTAVGKLMVEILGPRGIVEVLNALRNAGQL